MDFVRNDSVCSRHEMERGRENKSKKIILLLIVPLLIIGILLLPKIFRNNSSGENYIVSQIGNTEEKQEDGRRITFVGVGDNLIHSEVNEAAQQEDGSYNFLPMFTEVSELIKEKDLAFINQESIIGGDELGLSSYPAFNTPEDMSQNIKDLGFDLVSISNNHTLDKGKKGVENTLEIWKSKGVVVDGAFSSEEASKEIPIIEKNGLKIAFLAYTYGTNGIKPDKDWRVRYLNEENIRRDIEQAKSSSDFVLVSAHWGKENYYGKTDYQEYFADLFNELGVDVVIGTHPHVVGPVEELYNSEGEKTLIIYSTANFISSQRTSVDNMLGQIATFDFVKEGENKRIENIVMVPIVTYYEKDVYGKECNYKVIPLENYTEEMAEKHFMRYSKNSSMSPAYFETKFKETVAEQYR